MTRLWPGLAQPAFLWSMAGMLAVAPAGAAQSLAALTNALPGRVPAEFGAPEPGPIDAAAPPFVLQVSDRRDRERAVDCLAQAVYFEAGIEPLEGQRAVAQVVINRVRDRNFPDTVCGVVYQGHGRKTGCQFSFVCDGSARRRPPTAAQWRHARHIAEQALAGYVARDVGVATHYHADYVAPGWRRRLVEVSQVGTHIFYRLPGEAGLPDALTVQYAGGEPGYGRGAVASSLS